MKFAALFSLAAVAATAAVTTLPAIAAEDDEPAHVSRNWKSGSSTVSRGSAPNQRGSTRGTTQARDTSGDDLPKVASTRSSRDNEDNGESGNGRRYNNRRERHVEYGGLDPAEAARIHNAHRESDRRVTLHRESDYDDHEYSPRSYSSRGYRRQHWWSLWW